MTEDTPPADTVEGAGEAPKPEPPPKEDVAFRTPSDHKRSLIKKVR